MNLLLYYIILTSYLTKLFQNNFKNVAYINRINLKEAKTEELWAVPADTKLVAPV